MNNADIVIIVPKTDELEALGLAFDKDFSKSDGVIGARHFYYRFTHQCSTGSSPFEVSVVAVSINDQGNNVAANVTQEIIAKFRPTVVFLVGTAAGRFRKVNIGNVVVSAFVVDAQEWKIAKKAEPRIRKYEIPAGVLTDANRFILRMGSTGWSRKIKDSLNSKGLLRHLEKSKFGIEVKGIVGTNYLHLDPQVLRTLWAIDERTRCVDMESAGFGSVLERRRDIQWLAIRGISDFASVRSKPESRRTATAFCAAYFLRLFIEAGLVESHPNSLRIPEIERVELSPQNLYARVAAQDFMVKGIKTKIGLDISKIEIGSDLSLPDFQALCESRTRKRAEVSRSLAEVRQEYYTQKYEGYTYENDLRGLVPNWPDEFLGIVEDLGLDIARSQVMDVGAGNGLELVPLFDKARNLTIVDLSETMLKSALLRFPRAKAVCNSAENLSEIPTASIDVYISLRTYQSSFFDLSSALREAQRVLRSGGAIIISVANGFVETINGRKSIVRGLLIPGTKVIDRGAPRDFANRIAGKIQGLGFEGVGFLSDKTDIYIWAKKP